MVKLEVQAEHERNTDVWLTLETLNRQDANREYPGYKDFFRVSVMREHRFLPPAPCMARIRLLNSTCNRLRGDIMKCTLLQFLKDENGAVAMEYGLLTALIAAVIVAAVTHLASEVSSTFERVTESMR